MNYDGADKFSCVKCVEDDQDKSVWVNKYPYAF